MFKYLAEFAGAFILVSAILFAGPRPLWIALGFLAAILLAGPISGGHINPAVTAAMVFKGALPMVEAAPYVVAQLAGALAAVYAAKYFQST